MRFMIIRRADAQTESGAMPKTEDLAAMGAYNQQMIDAGILVDAEGLHDSSKGARVSFKKGVPTVTDGPFAEVKEIIAGFTMIEVKSKEEAIEWVRRWPEPDVELEVRRVFTAEDFGPSLTPELIAAEERMRAQVAQQHQ